MICYEESIATSSKGLILYTVYWGGGGSLILRWFWVVYRKTSDARCKLCESIFRWEVTIRLSFVVVDFSSAFSKAAFTLSDSNVSYQLCNFSAHCSTYTFTW
ncbi:hypothetical protein CW304_23970 [Bacillus sp. UFRGS-B20]|nr:hypothetical protein CW304_23970 [Bacillus sp. UFRGS-B20]